MPAAAAKSDQPMRASDSDAATVPSQEEIANLNLLGRIVWLLSLSPPHKHLFLADLEWRVRPPLLLKQCRLVQRRGRPFAFVSWALVTPDIAERLRKSPGERLRPDEWRSGAQPIFVDVVAPFGGAQEIAQDVAGTVFGKAMGNAAEGTPKT
jgi:cytolysin-activating lysine-acyltransferase